MAHSPDVPITITSGSWMHIRQIQVYHRRYPEIRGEDRTRARALAHLANQLLRALDFTPGRGARGELEQALTDVQAIRCGVGRDRAPRRRHAAAVPVLSTIS